MFPLDFETLKICALFLLISDLEYFVDCFSLPCSLRECVFNNVVQNTPVSSEINDSTK